MLKFYRYIFACARVNAEARRTSAPTFSGLMLVVAVVYLNLGTLLLSLPVLFGWHLPRLPEDRMIVVPIMALLAVLCWLLFIRSGKGTRLAEELKSRGEDSIKMCKTVAGLALFGSIALFFVPFILAPLLHPPGVSSRAPMEVGDSVGR